MGVFASSWSTTGSPHTSRVPRVPRVPRDMLLFQCHLQEGAAVWTGAIAHTAETGSHGLSVLPTGLEGFRVAGASLSWKVPISDTVHQRPALPTCPSRPQ